MSVQLLHIDGATITEKYNQDCQADCRFGRGNRQYEENEYLTGLITQVSRKRNEVKVDREQHQFNAHQQYDEIASINEDTGNAHCKQNPG
jgi:hypothetical protein